MSLSLPRAFSITTIINKSDPTTLNCFLGSIEKNETLQKSSSITITTDKKIMSLPLKGTSPELQGGYERSSQACIYQTDMQKIYRISITIDKIPCDFSTSKSLQSQ